MEIQRDFPGGPENVDIAHQMFSGGSEIRKIVQKPRPGGFSLRFLVPHLGHFFFDWRTNFLFFWQQTPRCGIRNRKENPPGLVVWPIFQISDPPLSVWVLFDSFFWSPIKKSNIGFFFVLCIFWLFFLIFDLIFGARDFQYVPRAINCQLFRTPFVSRPIWMHPICAN